MLEVEIASFHIEHTLCHEAASCCNAWASGGTCCSFVRLAIFKSSCPQPGWYLALGLIPLKACASSAPMWRLGIWMERGGIRRVWSSREPSVDHRLPHLIKARCWYPHDDGDLPSIDAATGLVCTQPWAPNQLS